VTNMPEQWNIRRLITWASEYLDGYGVESPRLSAELMLGMVLNLDRLQLYLRFDQPLEPEELAAFKRLLLRRRSHEPMAYILGSREFYGLDIQVGPGVLVPRPETEHLVEEGLKAIERVERPRILDLCTGSGCVALALAHERKDAQVIGVDLSKEALAFAHSSLDKLELDQRVQWLAGDLYDPLAAAGGFFDLITANPPYVREDEWQGLSEEVRGFEPRQALVSGESGLEIVSQIIAGSRAFLKPFGFLLMEVGAGQSKAALNVASQSGIFENLSVINDLAGIERVVVCQRGDYG
jgi:release factor glutamine methyltransferase